MSGLNFMPPSFILLTRAIEVDLKLKESEDKSVEGTCYVNGQVMCEITRKQYTDDSKQKASVIIFSETINDKKHTLVSAIRHKNSCNVWLHLESGLGLKFAQMRMSRRLSGLWHSENIIHDGKLQPIFVVKQRPFGLLQHKEMMQIYDVKGNTICDFSCEAITLFSQHERKYRLKFEDDIPLYQKVTIMCSAFGQQWFEMLDDIGHESLHKKCKCKMCASNANFIICLFITWCIIIPMYLIIALIVKPFK